MTVDFEKNTITIFGKKERFDVFVNRLAGFKGDVVYGFFSARSVAIPRKMNCMALFSVINERLKTIHASELSRDYFLRLEYYKDFSETQLYELFNIICTTKEEFKAYRTALFKLILMNADELKLTDGELTYLKNLKRQTVEKFETYFTYISSSCQEQEGTFDGQDIENLKELLVKSANVNEINYLAEKYGIHLPQSLKKNELLGFIKEYLNANNGGIGLELEDELDKMKVVELNSFCKKNRIPMSSNMAKDEQVFYLFYYLSQCEIINTPVGEILATEEFFPLEFKIDYSMLQGFTRDDTKRILHYEGEENDEYPLMEKDQALEEIEMIAADDNIEKPNYLDSDENLEYVEEIYEEVPEEEYTEEEVIYEYVDEDGNPVDMNPIEEKIETQEELDNEISKLIEENFKEEEAPKVEVKKPEEVLPKGGLKMDDVRDNSYCGNKRFIPKESNKLGVILGLSISAVILIAAVVVTLLFLK